jgi:hypothetical protein
MSIIVPNAAAIDAAAARVGVTDLGALTEHLGFDYSQPLSILMMALILTKLPIAPEAAFRIE